MLSWITETLPWKTVVNAVIGKTFNHMGLHEDPEAGMEVFMVRNGPGLHTTAHTHNCAHGLYVLSGSLILPLSSNPKRQDRPFKLHRL